jgi:hypothetical protein
MFGYQRVEVLGEGLPRTFRVAAFEAANGERNPNSLATPGKVQWTASVESVDSITPGSTRRAFGPAGPALSFQHNLLIHETDAVNDDRRNSAHGNHLSFQRSHPEQ